MACGGVVVPREARILQSILLYTHALFLSFSFNFLIKEAVPSPLVCFCVCVSLGLISDDICLLVLLVLWLDRVCCSLCTASDYFSTDHNILLIVNVFLKRDLYMLDYKIAEEFNEFSHHRRLMSSSLSFIIFY